MSTVTFLEDPVFPQSPSVGYVSAPSYRTEIVRSLSGVENRNRVWERPLHKYVVTIGPRAEDVVQDVLYHFHAMGGPECGFRFVDLLDYKSCRSYETPTALDQPLIAGTSSPGGYQMVKDYIFGTRSQRRYIFKPKAGSVLVANEAGVEQAAADFDVDDQTGVITPLAGFVGVPTTCGFEFDVPVRYESDELPVSFDFAVAESVSFGLLELRFRL